MRVNRVEIYICEPDEVLDGRTLMHIDGKNFMVSDVQVGEKEYEVWIDIGSEEIITNSAKWCRITMSVEEAIELRNHLNRVLREIRKETEEQKVRGGESK